MSRGNELAEATRVSADGVTAFLCFVVAAASLGAAALAWSGRWRSWSRRVFTGPLPLPITLLPGLGFAFLGAGLYESGTRSGVVSLLLIPLVIGQVLYFWAPAWFGPGWLRQERAAGPQPDLDDPATALAYAASTPRPTATTQLGGGSVSEGEPLHSWRATWLHDVDATERPHGIQRPGAIDGRLSLHPDGLAFAAHGLEDRLRASRTRLSIGRDGILGARVVCAGAGADGVKRTGKGARSAFSRLVVETSEGPYLFEVSFARRKAERITETLRPGG